MPDANFFGSDEFGYEASDGTDTTANVVHIMVDPVNDPPVAAFVTYPATEGEAPLRVNFLAEYYSNDVDGPDLAWNEGQFAESRIYRQVLTLP